MKPINKEQLIDSLEKNDFLVKDNTITIDLSEQKCGTYFLRLDNETIKIIKQ